MNLRSMLLMMILFLLFVQLSRTNLVFNLDDISAVFTLERTQRRQAFNRGVIGLMVEELVCWGHDDVLLMLGQEIDSSFGDSLTLSLFFLGDFGLLRCCIFRWLSTRSSILFLVIDVMS